jgi:hypothetical protein
VINGPYSTIVIIYGDFNSDLNLSLPVPLLRGCTQSPGSAAANLEMHCFRRVSRRAGRKQWHDPLISIRNKQSSTATTAFDYFWPFALKSVSAIAAFSAASTATFAAEMGPGTIAPAACLCPPPLNCSATRAMLKPRWLRKLTLTI